MLYVQLDVNWPDHHKVIEVGIEGAGLHAIVLCLAKRQETDGWVHRRMLYRQGATDDLIDRVASCGLLDLDGSLVRPHGWHDRNPSQAAIDAKRASKSEAGKRGNHARHHAPGPYEFCAKCHVIAGSDRTGSQASDCDPTSSPYTEKESVGAIPLATVLLDPPAMPRIPATNCAEAKDQLEALRERRALVTPSEAM